MIIGKVYKIGILIPIFVKKPFAENKIEKAMTIDTGGKKNGIKMVFSRSKESRFFFL
jgi:hypothetical protein